ARRNELCRQFTSENIDDLVKLRRQALEKARIASSKDLSALRAALADGDPCPLCGSPEHPYAAGNIPSASREEQALNEITALQEELATLGNDLGILEERERQQQNNLQQAEEEQKIAALQLTQCREALAQAEADFAEKSGSAAASVRALQTEVAVFGVVMSDDAAEIPAELRQRAEKFESAENQLKIYGGNVEKLQADLQHHIAAKEAAEPRWQESRRTLEELQRKLNELTGERKAILGASTTADAEDRLLEAEAAAARELERCRVELDDKQQSEKKLLDKKSGMEGDCTALALQAREAAEALERKLRENRITLEQYKTWILEESELLKLTAERTELDTKTESAGKTLQAAQEKLQKAREALNPCITREEVSREADALRDGVEADNKNSGALQQALEAYQRQQNAMQERSAALLQAQKTFQYWDDFSRMVARGDRLADFAQQINLERLLRAANGYLNSLSKRYMLFREEGSEERETRNNHSIWVIDNHRGGEKRRSGNLSGGEKFLVSLALALGLGRLNSGSTPAENFFLDEGFGNLSGEALDNAINTLKNLKGDGKLVGVISHVREIAENINCRLLLRKKGNGISEIRGPGVTAVETAAPAKKKRRRRAAIPEAEDGTE
ncbi:MAG: hypothetical protein J6S21_01380, partial [Victivallales bacterium]|nr:hypothetical protein [Victivallales bacterium]